jgi:hypothetical protein
MGKLSVEVAALAPRRGVTCTVGAWLATLSKADRLDVDEVMASGAFGTTISKAVEKVYGVRVGADAIQRHRRGACQCPR